MFYRHAVVSIILNVDEALANLAPIVDKPPSFKEIGAWEYLKHIAYHFREV